MSLSDRCLRPLVPLVLFSGLALTLAGCEPPPVETEQLHVRGLGMEQVTTVRARESLVAANQVPEPAAAVSPANLPAGKIFQNLQVLGHVDAGEFTRLMASITTWVSPVQGCAYCHAGPNYALDDVYTKSVARRMLEMTVAINTQWKDHVGETGVTCFTCHRGAAVPANYWHAPGPLRAARGPAGGKAGQNAPATLVGLTSLPNDPFSTYLLGDQSIRIQSSTALPTSNRNSIKQAESTYGFMMHISTSLGVNCGFCHNSRAFSPWESSTPARVKAWHGIQMVRSLNDEYFTPLADILPPERLGPHGDAFKVNCATCHQGASKPLLGVSMLADYAVLAQAPPSPTTMTTTPTPTESAQPAPSEEGAQEVQIH